MTKKVNNRSKQSSLGDDAKQLYEQKIRDLESMNDSLKCDVEELMSKLADVSISSSVGTLQSSREFSQKSIATKEEGMSSRSNSKLRSMSSKKKHISESSVKQIDGEVQKLKAQKVKLQCKIKLDSMHFRLSKAALEKEVLQLKKELRKNEFEKHVLSAMNNRQKQVLQLKSTQAFAALKRLKFRPHSKKIPLNKNKVPPKGTSSGIQESSNDLGLLVKLNKVHSLYERQMKELAEEVQSFSLEASVLKAEFEEEKSSYSASCDNQISQSPMDSELKELKEEFNKLSTLVSQMERTKSQLSETNKVQVINLGEPAEYSITSKNPSDESNLELSPTETSEETLFKKEQTSQPESSEETLFKKEQSKAEVCCSCTKKSFCKTKSCKCRAKGNGCGDSCGCLASKCSNREANVKPDKATLPEDGKNKPAGTSHDEKDANKNPLRDIGNIQVKEAVKVGKMRKRVGKK